MTIFLKQSTAATIMFGPFVDKTDAVTLKTDATTITDIDHATTGIFLSKNGGTAAVRNGTPTASVADAYGMMKVTLNTTDTGTAGSLDVLFAKAATYLPVSKSFQVLPANAYDALVSGSGVGLRADVQGWLGTAPATPTTNGVPEVDLTHVAGATTDVSALATNVAAILVDTGTTLDGRIPAALVGGRMDATVDATGMEAGATAAIRDAILARTTASGVVGSGSTTANVVASSVAVGATTSLSADAWKGRVIIFNSDTSTAALRGQAATIVSHTSGTTPTFTLATGAWTTAPLTTDTFTVV